jgi:proteasome accessory factor A
MTLQKPIDLVDGTSMTALEMQWEYLDRARKFAEEHGLDSIGGDEVGREVLRRWEAVLTGLESDPGSVAAQVDWVAKHRVIDGYRERHDLRWDDARLAAMDLQYHDLRADKSLAARVGLERIAGAEEIDAAMTNPPLDTRAYFRGRCLQRWPENIVAANWDSLVFDVGGDPLRRVPMMEPLRGTHAHVASLIDTCESAADLLDKLGQ